MRLASANMMVTIVGRDAARDVQVLQRMQDAGGSGHEFVQCDCLSIASVRKCSQAIMSKSDSLNVLVLTQGMATI